MARALDQLARKVPLARVADYLRAAVLLGAQPDHCVAIEDSSNGLRSASAARMAVIAVPNRHYPPEADTLALAAVIVPTIADVTPELVDSIG